MHVVWPGLYWTYQSNRWFHLPQCWWRHQFFEASHRTVSVIGTCRDPIIMGWQRKSGQDWLLVFAPGSGSLYRTWSSTVCILEHNNVWFDSNNILPETSLWLILADTHKVWCDRCDMSDNYVTALYLVWTCCTARKQYGSTAIFSSSAYFQRSTLGSKTCMWLIHAITKSWWWYA